MASLVEIFNRALSRLGARRISDPTENSPGAKACNAAWPMVRDEVLRAHPWNFALSRQSLAAESAAPEWGYDYAYRLPANTLRVLKVDTEFEWVTEAGLILTDASAPLDVLLVIRETDTQKYDAMFASTAAARLAAEVSQEVNAASGAQQQSLMAIYLKLLAQARMTDAMESTPPELEVDQWVRVRL